MNARPGSRFDPCAAMGRWEIAVGQQLRPGDRVVLDRRAVDEYLTIEAHAIDWESLEHTAHVVREARTRRGRTSVVLENTVGRVCDIEDELVLRRLGDHDRNQ